MRPGVDADASPSATAAAFEVLLETSRAEPQMATDTDEEGKLRGASIYSMPRQRQALGDLIDSEQAIVVGVKRWTRHLRSEGGKKRGDLAEKGRDVSGAETAVDRPSLKQFERPANGWFG